ncbi:MAG: glycogen synthase GlgA [Candidatus Methylacidiphilales bacterium]
MNILFAASEMSPLAKTGGLGDVLAALPAALRRAGHSVSVALPLYRDVRQRLENLRPTTICFKLQLGLENHTARIWTGTSKNGVRIFAIENDPFFDRPTLYGEGSDYADNGARFIFFSRAVVELAAWLQPLPQIIHANDWQTALIPGLVKSRGLPYRTVFTIHNLAYQGIFPSPIFSLTGLPESYYSSAGYEHFGSLNLMKGALRLANEITTVSPGYAKDIQTGEFGCGFDGLLRDRSEKLTGIVNGIDTDIWNPETDPFLDVNYSFQHLSRKDTAKRLLQNELGWGHNTTAPIFGCVSRLVGQKGLDVVAEAAPDLLARGARLVILGSGDPVLEETFTSLARLHPTQVHTQIGFDEALAHRIEAGVDFFLMPSRFEPCGLNQMYSQRYGTIPIVHQVGGLRDTVEPWRVARKGFLRGTGTGLSFSGLDRPHLMAAIDEALHIRRFRPFWNQIRQNAMSRDFSWQSILPQYENLYQKALA